MKEIGAQLLVKTVKGLATGNFAEIPQSEFINPISEIHHAPKIFTDDCKIDFNKNVEEVFNLVRGLSPYPAAFTMFHHKKLKIFKAEKINKTPAVAAGAFETDEKTFLQIACNNGYLNLLNVQLEGKKRLDIKDFLRGYRFS
jgi:methionyl-tRNA formyltransferase